MYSILIKDSRTNNYRFFTVKKEEVSQANLKRISCVGIGTGRDDTVIFSTSSLEELETKCIELLNNHKSTEIVPINVLSYSTDLVWGFDTESDRDVFEQEAVDFSDFFVPVDAETDNAETS